MRCNSVFLSNRTQLPHTCHTTIHFLAVKSIHTWMAIHKGEALVYEESMTKV